MSTSLTTSFDPAILRGLTQRRISRRRFFRYASAGAGALVVPSLLSSCDRKQATAFDWSAWWKRQQRSGTLDFANWPFYIDRTRDNSHPSLDLFTQETGIEVNYSRPIRDDATFLERITPALSDGRAIGYDIIVITNGPQLSALLYNDWLIPLDHAYLTNFSMNASTLVKDPSWDPGNRFTVAWQSGLTGIAYRPEAVDALKRTPTSVLDLWDESLVGRVGMLQDQMDLGSFGLLAVGAEPSTSSVTDWTFAADKLREQRRAGLVPKYYDQGYIRALERGDIWITQAWSGDVFQSNQLGHPELKFVVPSEGAMFWTDNMMIPIHAAHPVDALTYMDFVYRPDVAAMIADWVWYITPVPASQQIIADRFGDEAVAKSPLVFPTDASLSSGAPPLTSDSPGSSNAPWTLHEYFVFHDRYEISTWEHIFGPVIDASTTP